jgi:hypothetical protein
MAPAVFPLDDLRPGVPAPGRPATRLALDLVCGLWPETAGNRADLGLVPLGPLAWPLAFDALAGSGQGSVSRASLHDHAVIVRARGGFLSTDRVVLARFDAAGDEWSLTLEITHVENPNLDPAPRDLVIVLALALEDATPSRISIEFAGRIRHVRGDVQPLVAPVAPSLGIDVTR